MFGWRKRRDGFEWREYVRTTILLKRKKRSDRIEAVKQDAASKLGQAARACGDRCAAAAQAAARYAGSAAAAMKSGSRNGARHGVGIAAAGARSAGGLARRSLNGLRAGLAAAVSGLSSGTAFRGLRLDSLRRATTSLQAVPVVRFAGWALVGAAAARAAFDSFDFIAGGLAVAGLVMAAVSTASWSVAAEKLGQARQVLEDRLGDLDARALSRSASRYRGALTGFVAVIAGGLLYQGVLVAADAVSGEQAATVTKSSRTARVPIPVQKSGADWWPNLELPSLLPTASFFGGGSEVISGRARVVSGDTLIIGGRTIRLAGIEAPETRQTCSRPGSRRWRCGVSAERALERLVRRKSPRCEAEDIDSSGVVLAICRVGETDLAADLVRRGHVFTEGGIFPRYASAEAEAREKRSGLWSGTAERPDDFRQKRWQRAAQNAPDGCPIKGRDHRRRGKIYIVPWSVSYERYRVRERRGDRWFCSEKEAIQAGWKPMTQS